MASSKPSFGQSEANAGCVRAAIRFVSNYRSSQGLPIRVHEDELVGDNLIVFMQDLCIFCCSRAIPQPYDDRLEPVPDRQGNISDRHLSGDALLGCCGLFLNSVRQQHPNHLEFVNLGAADCPQWWTGTRNNVRSILESLEITK